MAHYNHLPIYRTAMKLAVHLENTVRSFPRYVKYTLGSEMRLVDTSPKFKERRGGATAASLLHNSPWAPLNIRGGTHIELFILAPRR